MEGGSTAYACKRCGEEFPPTSMHTKIVRRDFVEVPRPATIERLCEGCWKVYIEEFLDARLATYDSK